MLQREPQLTFLFFLTVMNWHEELIGKLPSAAGILLIFNNKKSPNNFCLASVGYNVIEHHYSSSFTMKIVIMLLYAVLCQKVNKNILFILSTQCLIILIFSSLSEVTEQDQLLLYELLHDLRDKTVAQGELPNMGMERKRRQGQKGVESSCPLQALESV